LRQIDGPVGAAAALKMSYSGISKGLTAIGAAMLLAASRSGSARSLHQELSESLPQLLSRFETGIPDMYPKAYRWVAEMREIAAFLQEDKAAAMIFEGAAQLYERLAADVATEGPEQRVLDAFFHSTIN
jgi:putative dehydrogenase